MADKNKKLLGAGLFFIFFAFLCAFVALYFVGNANRQKEERIAALEVQLLNLISDKGQQTLSASDARQVRRAPVTETEYLEKAESLYGPQELDRRQGVLWIDRNSGMLVATLGMVNGLEEGDRLSVYQDDRKIGEVQAQTVFDIISYVQPVGMTLAELPDNYYRIVNEALP